MADIGGLHVIATERNESGRIDRQLFGRCARQGDPGSAQAMVSLEDEFVSRYARHSVSVLKKWRGAGQRKQKNAQGPKSDAPALEAAHAAPYPKVVASLFSYAQRRADRLALSRRKSVIKSDHWLDDHLSFAGKE